MANIAIYLVHRMVIPESILHQRPTPIPPPRPGFMQWQDSITLVLVVGLSAAIKVTQKWITTEKERKQLEQERTEAELKNLKINSILISIQYAQQYLLAYRYQSRTGPKRSS